VEHQILSCFGFLTYPHTSCVTSSVKWGQEYYLLHSTVNKYYKGHCICIAGKLQTLQVLFVLCQCLPEPTGLQDEFVTLGREGKSTKRTVQSLMQCQKELVKGFGLLLFRELG
jgi:hypothetical protein